MVVDRVVDAHTGEAEVLRLPARGTDGHAQHAVFGRDCEGVGVQQHAVIDLRDDVVGVEVDQCGDPDGLAGVFAARTGEAEVAQPLAHILGRPALGLDEIRRRPGNQVDPGHLEVAAQVDGVVLAHGVDHDVLAGRGRRTRIDLGTVADRRGRLMIEEDHGHRAGDRGLLLPDGGRLGPRIDEVVVEAEIAVQVGRQGPHEGYAGVGHRRKRGPASLVGVVHQREIDAVAVRAGVLVSCAGRAAAGVSGQQLNRVSGIEHLDTVARLVGRLDVLEGCDQVAAEGRVGVEGIECFGFDRELAGGVDRGVAGDVGVGIIAVLAVGDRD